MQKIAAYRNLLQKSSHNLPSVVVSVEHLQHHTYALLISNIQVQKFTNVYNQKEFVLRYLV
jgi:hypothetical protein